MADPRGRCRLFTTTQGCRFGSRCKFSHDQSTIPPAGTSNASPSRGSKPSNRTQSQNLENSTPSTAPRMVCRLFWDTGKCNRSFDCRFKHERKPDAAGEQPEPAPAEEPDFFSLEGMVSSSGATGEDLHRLNPSEAHNHIMFFLKNNYSFENASKVQGFTRILASINDRNKTWNSDSAQAFLDFLVKGDGIIRIGEVLRYQPVNYRIGNGRNTLSFQRGYFPIFQFMASNLIVKSTWHKNINHLYTAVKDNYEIIHEVLEECIGGMIEQYSWKDPTPRLVSMLQNSLDGVVVFKTLTTVLLQYFNRFKDAIRNHPQIVTLVKDLMQWFEIWAADVSSGASRFGDGIADADAPVRRTMISQLREEVKRLLDIVQRESEHTERLKRPSGASGITLAQRTEADMMRFTHTYDPPGNLRQEGPRHDNDYVDISDIRIAPTNAELLCPLPPYLPVFRPEAPHHLRENSMERHLDIQFRLLREELVAPIRSSLAAVFEDLNVIWQSSGRRRARREPTKLEGVLKNNGGAYKTSGFDSLFFHIYTGVEFAQDIKTERRDLSVGLLMDPPPGAARLPEAQSRAGYWKHSKRLQSGSLVALAIVTGSTLDVFLGVVSSFGDDIVESAKALKDRIQVQVTFFDPEIEFRALKRDRLTRGLSSYAFLVDNSIMFEATRPFLERIQTIEPTEIPFARYIAQGGSLGDVQILSPKYATAPNFSFKLGSLARNPGDRIEDLNIELRGSLHRVRRQLLESSRLDPSQVDALVNTLTREVSLIQGPPGTGKSYIGREIIRVLIESKIKPIVLIAYTNHALDHMLTALLDEGITRHIVRLGSRSSDERIAEYTLDKLEKTAEKSSLSRSCGNQYRVIKCIEEDMADIMESIQLPTISVMQIRQFLEIHFPEHFDALFNPPYWISVLYERIKAEEAENGEWEKVGNKGKKKPTVTDLSGTLYEFWKTGQDIAFISSELSPEKRTVKSEPSAQGEAAEETVQETSQVEEFFASIGFLSEFPPIPSSDRDITVLENTDAVWSMALPERMKLADLWERRIRRLAYDSNLGRYKELRESYKEACKEYNDIRDETRRRLLSQVDLIGCTTTGAAKLTSLIESIAPKVLIVEEAGQVLEAHILTTLVPSVNHLICIGDPQQLRPTLATFALSMENARGEELFRLDQSLMERLSGSGMPMSQLNVQRRMRPSISHFIRTILYPKLEDNPLVLEYPPVQGVLKDVYFLNHTHAEGGAEDSVSKFNTFEVKMIVDLVLYFLKQGSYSGEGDIAVLCAYLGQVQKVRQILRDMKISVAVDERDQEQLIRQGLEEESDVSFESVVVSKHIRLGTVDIYQGQEAKIVIVSLVRNTGNYETKSASIGFLKSVNRINVALSRAKHGMYILGNASNLRKNGTWSTILDEMELAGQIGPGIPIACLRHPDQVQTITKPGELSRFAPEGGCLLPCGFQLPCGHICPSVCHAVLDNHRSTRCRMRCNRTPCPRSHPCSRECSQDCGNCEFPISNVKLPCGHVEKSVPCYQFDKLDEYKCPTQVVKRLSRCEHSKEIPCHKDPATVTCSEPCGRITDCCSKSCKSRCHECQTLSRPEVKILGSVSPIDRIQHGRHPCERMLYCMHKCGQDCHSKDIGCNRACKEPCRQQCAHQECKKNCSTSCAPCMEPCTWVCAHHKCPVTCGSICARLPCDEPCTNALPCGHRCPSVCGEPCEQQRCIECLSSSQKQDIVDYIMQRRLEEIELDSSDIGERLITLRCGHIFTVETLDGHCHMSDFYKTDDLGLFVSMKVPPFDYQTPPTCPMCRGPITAMRYGRVIKRATLDILEQNVASSMTRSLERLNPAFERVASEQNVRLESARAISADANNISDEARDREGKAVGKLTEPMPVNLIDRGAMHNVHGLSPTEAKAWFDVVKDILSLYRDTVKIANTRGAHVKAYEGAYATLYRLELDTIVAEGTASSANAPEDAAIQAARLRIGQSPPNADTKYQIEAYFRSIELRFQLAQIAEARIDGIPAAVLNTGEGRDHRKRWLSFVNFVYDSCISDSEKALVLSKKSSAWRRVARCVVYQIRSDFEKFRFRVLCNVVDLLTTDPDYSRKRDQLIESVKEKVNTTTILLNKYRREYLQSWPSAPLDQLREMTWFRENFQQKVSNVIENLNELEKSVQKRGKYQPVTKEEMLDIVRALDFATTGHFYTCPNGHPYTIGECGGAMQTSVCPECGEQVGGSSHALLPSNRRAEDFESLLRERGARPGFVDMM